MNPTLKGAIKSKINWLGFSLIVLGYLEMKQDLLLQYVPHKWQGLATLLIGGAVTVARFFTRESLEDKGLGGKPDDTDQQGA
jgi:hypothetical protein